MISKKNLKNLSFLIYGLGLTGKSVVNFFIKNNVRNFKVWDDQNKNLYKNKRSSNLSKTLRSVDYIILSPGVSLVKSKNKNNLIKFKKKIITDLDLFFLVKKFSQSIVITGTNGKSTTSKILSHVLKKNNFQPVLGGNIGAPVLSLKVKKKILL
jgi:UDP-N-acetylmuramoylalanine--D-glutamate ligase